MHIKQQIRSGIRIDCKKLLEVRNAMLDECGHYIPVIAEACSGAVMIAYWYHSNGC